MDCERFRETCGGTEACGDEESDEAVLHMDCCRECSDWFDNVHSLSVARFELFLADNPSAAQGFYMALAADDFPQARLVHGPERIGRA
mgnify:CR=1 FL=1